MVTNEDISREGYAMNSALSWLVFPLCVVQYVVTVMGSDEGGAKAFCPGSHRANPVKGKTEWKDSCGDSTMGERQPIYTGVRGVLAGRLAGHKTMPASSLIHGAPPLTNPDSTEVRRAYFFFLR